MEEKEMGEAWGDSPHKNSRWPGFLIGKHFYYSDFHHGQKGHNTQ
jgi:hypothetical protein